MATMGRYPQPEISLLAFIDILGLGVDMMDDYVHAFGKIESFQEKLATERELRERLAELKIFTFSDSLYLVLPLRSDMDNNVNVISFCTLMSNLMGTCLLDDIAIRGAISIGNVMTASRVIIDGQTFVSGRPVLEAYGFESIQNWVGISFVPRHCIASSMRPKYVALASLLRDEGIALDYEVPVRDTADLTESLALCWNQDELDSIREKVAELIQAFDGEPVVQKYLNTQTFLEFQLRSLGGQ